MDKPKLLEGYQEADLAAECEQLLATLLHGLGPWRESVYLVGGLVPRYLVKKRPPEIPVHAGTRDVDIVVDLLMLGDTDAYQTLEENLKRRGFERDENAKHQKVSWRWFRKTESGHKLILEFLADDPKVGGGKVQELPTEGAVSALNVPFASMVVDFHEVVRVNVELLDEGGVFEADIRYADIVSFTCLKALAFADRAERKDAHDLAYCLEHWPGGVDGAAKLFRERAGSKHADAMRVATDILRRRFTTTNTEEGGTIEGFRKDGPVAVALFELGEAVSPELRERRVLRQRQAADLVERLVAAIAAGEMAPPAAPAE